MKSLKKIFVIFAVVTAFGATAAFADGTGQTNAPCNSNNGSVTPPAPAGNGSGSSNGAPAAGGATVTTPPTNGGGH